MGKFYITTPIYYVNDRPHIGTAYTTVAADILARWHRLAGDEVFFLTGTDEHGAKIYKAAIEKGKTPKEFVDGVVPEFISAWKTMDISYDKFIRTTDTYHEDSVKKFVMKLWEKGDIYKGTYTGLYCVPDETFVSESDAKDGKCPSCGRQLETVSEEAYFFKLSKYKDRVIELIKNGLVLPDSKKNELLNRLSGDLKDLDITRKSVKWGIEFPPDPSHTIYVWFDALLNYVTALGWPDGEDFKKFWPADVHIVGKDIVWFHSVIWPAMLMAADIPPPKTVISHGWWTIEGRKMSKSLGNAIDPVKLSEKYSADAVRYFMAREKQIWDDGDFSEKSLESRINGELMADLSNLVARVLTIAEKSNVPESSEVELDGFIDFEEFSSFMGGADIFNALETILAGIRKVNKYFNDRKPWASSEEEKSKTLYNALEALRMISIVITPFMPSVGGKIANQLGLKQGKASDLKFSQFKGQPKRGPNLFEKL
ncbi:MAG: methionine--tRNA ligase [Candidatus Parvarchaeota archaeon]|jgi:methionyl-tRNA synthetase|nr:methionine--tRNA ligase [Candidatus Parvarchaeota archaeon]